MGRATTLRTGVESSQTPKDIVINELPSIKLFPAAFLAVVAHRVLAPLIAYLIGKRHAEVRATYPVFDWRDTGAVVRSGTGLFLLLKFIVKLEFLKLRDRTLTMLCVPEICVVTIALGTLLILLGHFLGPAVSALAYIFMEVVTLLPIHR